MCENASPSLFHVLILLLYGAVQYCPSAVSGMFRQSNNAYSKIYSRRVSVGRVLVTCLW